ncbi:MAG: hypothetical protein JRF53_18305 [Deltaproteobacteria bacterium]|nr:hypothetical protein [Deltaproteobacteria bacterium]
MNRDANVQVLDCTIRDGGYINNWDFSPRMVRDVYQRLSRAGVDFIEIGFRDAVAPVPGRGTQEGQKGDTGRQDLCHG